MLGFLSVCVALAISAFYEPIEWWTALLLGQGAEEFLGTQGGSVGHPPSDMFLALIGAVVAVLGLSGLQYRRIRRLVEHSSTS